MTIYENRFDVLKKHLYETVPVPSRIYSIMTTLEISQRITMELCYKSSRSKFRSYLKPELEEPGFEDPFIQLMPANVWRYFKLNCCIYADRYKEPSPYTKYSAKRMYKPLSHTHLDFIRYLNNWYNASVFLGIKKDASLESASGFYIDKSQVGKGRKEEEDDDINFILNKADELAHIYGFKCAEDLVLSELLNPQNKKINILLAS
ncbi:hypothetical protein [Psychrobacter sp. AOP31-A1-22]|uniref:hypothetical protein n=1 Tax=Psychrobacter sp. AOP31-A1-22 TaxID=3457696 RepID=UPI004036BA52